MGFQHKKSVTYWLSQVARSHRVVFGNKLAEFDLHAGQEIILKVLAEENGQTMGALAAELGVQPPTVTKTVARLTAQGLLTRETSKEDARQSHVYITDKGLELIKRIDKTWKRLERRALTGLDEKERRQLRKLLKRVDRNIANSGNLADMDADDEDDIVEHAPDDEAAAAQL